MSVVVSLVWFGLLGWLVSPVRSFDSSWLTSWMVRLVAGCWFAGRSFVRGLFAVGRWFDKAIDVCVRGDAGMRSARTVISKLMGGDAMP